MLLTQVPHEDLIDKPLYPPKVAARFLRIATSTIRWWALGTGTHPPVIRIAEQRKRLLSFRNLVEAHVLSAILCQNDRIPLALIRAVLALLEELLHSEHPLSDKRMESEGKDFFVARLGQLINATKHWQAAINSTLASYLKRVRRDERGEPSRLMLFTPGRSEGPEYIIIDPAVQSGTPCVASTGATTAVIAERFRDGKSVVELASGYGCGPEEIEEAIRYEAD